MLLGAYYYLWYGRPNLPIIGGGVWGAGYTNTPIFGEYNSRKQEIINQQIDWAKAAGIDFFIINWANADSWDDITLKDFYLNSSRNREIKFCLHYDSSITLNRITTERSYDYNFDDQYSPLKTKGEKFLEDFEYLAKTYFNHPQYLRINGKPVVYVYNVSSFRNIAKYFDKLKEKMKERGIELFLIADVVCWAGVKITKHNLSFLWNTPPKRVIKAIGRALGRLSLKKYENDFSLSKYFNGISGYNMYGENRVNNFLENIDSLYKKFRDYAENNNLLFIPNIIPGYDDRKLKGFDRVVLKRENGDFYRKMFKIAQKYIDSSCPFLTVTSFNEWHEGTEIESSKEYGEKYLKLTKESKEKMK